MDGRRNALDEGCTVEAAPAVFLRGIQQKKIGQSPFGDEPFKIAHIAIRDARSAPAHHVETGDFIGRAVLTDLQQLSNADGQRKAFPARGVIEAPFELASVQRYGLPDAQPHPACGHGQGFGVVLGKVREMNFDAWIVESDGLAIGCGQRGRPEATGKR